RERPVLDVVEVEAYGVVPGLVFAATHLPQTGDPWLDEMPAMLVVDECRALDGQRARADERHLAAQDVDQLGQLVERGLSEQPPDPSHPWIGPYFEQQTVAL